MVKRICLVGIVLVVTLVVVMASASIAMAAPGDHSNVIGSVHDVTAGTGVNPCENCHLPHHSGTPYLWARTPNATGGGGVGPSDGSSDIKPLCYSCHDGSVTPVGGDTIFDTTKVQHRTTSRTIRGSAGRDCDLCHDPHEGVAANGRDNFIRYQRIGSTRVIGTIGPNVCVSCHTDRVEGGLDRNGNGPFHNHPLDVNASSAINPAMVVYDPATDTWGSRLFTNQPKCESCHAPHGAYDELLNTMDASDGSLCVNCHK